LHQTKWLLYTETATEGHYSYLKTQEIYEKSKQILNFFSTLFKNQDTQIIPNCMLCLILHWRT